MPRPSTSLLTIPPFFHRIHIMDFKFEENEQHGYKEVAFKDNTIAVENLPFPIVLYPGHYGTFFGFKKNSDSPTVICSCAKEAIENYIRLRMIDTAFIQTSKYHKQFVLCDMHFPKSLVDHLKEQSLPNDITIVGYLLFENKLCHE